MTFIRDLTRTDPRYGYVKGEPTRFLRGHASRLSPVDYIVNEETGCWEWQLGLSSGGYGLMTRGGRQHYAHRWHYEQAKGLVAEGLQVDHLCRNRCCVNPEHLEPVTCAENVRRSGTAKLSPKQVETLRELKTPRHGEIAALARQLGISRNHAYRIRRGKRWAT